MGADDLHGLRQVGFHCGRGLQLERSDIDHDGAGPEVRVDRPDRAGHLADGYGENDDVASGCRGDVRSHASSTQTGVDQRLDRVKDVEGKMVAKMLGNQSAEGAKSYNSDGRDRSDS